VPEIQTIRLAVSQERKKARAHSCAVCEEQLTRSVG